MHLFFALLATMTSPRARADVIDDVTRVCQMPRRTALAFLFPTHIWSLRGMPTSPCEPQSAEAHGGARVSPLPLTPPPLAVCLQNQPCMETRLEVNQRGPESGDGSFERVTQVDHTA